MSAQRPDVVKKNCNGLLRLAFACALLALFAAAPLHSQTYQDLYDFGCGTGCAPSDYGRLTQGTDGNLYGTDSSGGAFDFGSIFKVDPSGSPYTGLWDFDGAPTGQVPLGALTLASADGNFYGTTSGGGTFGNGTLFRFNPTSNFITVLHQFSDTEGPPTVPPVEAKDKNLYGLTNTGTTYRLTVASGTFALLPNKTPAGGTDAPLFLASDGNLYGTTILGGKSNLGTVFRMTTAGKIQVIHNFSGADGFQPLGPLVQGKDGNLYGTTYYGGGVPGVQGTVYKITLSPMTFTTLHNFIGTDGGNPTAGLMSATDGNLYGTTTYGGANLVGTLFTITTGGVFTKLFDFSDTGVGGVSGANPWTTMMEDTNGLFYGLTVSGVIQPGTFYSVTPANVKLNITLCCNWWLVLDQPVNILGNNLTGAVSVSFGSVAAQFRPGSETYLTAKVPSGAVDGLITVTLATGQQLQSQQAVHILPKITNLDPSSGAVGTQVNITGGGFAGTSKVTFGGVATGNFTVITPALIQATVPAGAVTGKIVVTTPNGTATSKQTFTVN